MILLQLLICLCYSALYATYTKCFRYIWLAVLWGESSSIKAQTMLCHQLFWVRWMLSIYCYLTLLVPRRRALCALFFTKRYYEFWFTHLINTIHSKVTRNLCALRWGIDSIHTRSLIIGVVAPEKGDRVYTSLLSTFCGMIAFRLLQGLC